MIYNAFSDGAWCSGSTWASDSHCVGSIPIAPANANTLTTVRVFCIISATNACILIAEIIQNKLTTVSVCVEHQRSGTEGHAIA